MPRRTKQWEDDEETYQEKQKKRQEATKAWMRAKLKEIEDNKAKAHGEYAPENLSEAFPYYCSHCRFGAFEEKVLDTHLTTTEHSKMTGAFYRDQ